MSTPEPERVYPKRRAAAERNREKILTAARQAFAESDAPVSMAEICRRAGVAMPTLYRNFSGRPELLRELYLEEEIGDNELDGSGRFLARLLADCSSRLLCPVEVAHGRAHSVATRQQACDHPARQIAPPTLDKQCLGAVGVRH